MKHLKKFENLNESSGFIILLAAWFLYDSLSKIPKEQWAQFMMENTKDMFSDFVKFLTKYEHHRFTPYCCSRVAKPMSSVPLYKNCSVIKLE